MNETQEDYVKIFTELENRWMNAWNNKDEQVVNQILADEGFWEYGGIEYLVSSGSERERQRMEWKLFDY